MSIRILLLLLALFAFSKPTQATTNINERHLPEIYIVYVQPPEKVDLLSSKDLDDYYHSFLTPTTTDDSLPPTMVYSYRHAISGFAARMTPDHITTMRANPGFIQVHPDRIIPLAIYKVCSTMGCKVSDIAAGLDAAIKDGVDILSLSLGGPSLPYSIDPVAIGAFAAMQRGIFISCAAGNKGPSASTISNEAPWILTVGASTIDRSIRSTVKLGDGTEINGETLFQPKKFKPDQLPLVDRPFNTTNVKGKVVLCEPNGDVLDVDKGRAVKKSGGAGMIIMNAEGDAYTITADAHVLPASHISYADGLKLKAYVNSTSNATVAIIFKGTIVGNSTRAPTVASFSARGPSQRSGDILKPDIIGPGTNVLAAWPFKLKASYTSKGPTFNIMWGTSMSTPHLSGVAALIKSTHWDWSPAMIKSAILTTADKVDHQGEPIADQNRTRANLFATGAGHVNPSKAINPGLVYDIGADNYASHLCAHNYTDEDIAAITQKKTRCVDYQKFGGSDLNYPSFTGYLNTSGPLSQTYDRTVTNVGEANSTYELEVDEPSGVSVVVKPQKLQFSQVNEKASYFVTLSINASAKGSYAEGELRWVSDKHVVRSPISVFLKT
ncbi:Subtilisin-like protease SDD1 [Acorus gramineus]|uniref:Subtilisin-like protease SDD1 n=1 Tax=Acorus gramineus TaxID=55184 RepID=A0AAV9B994_ACOGR|nr:Subtilisin-like protease SDD1 [Acorus gramineus]